MTTAPPTPLTVSGTCLLAFVDETGEESLGDPEFPVFGLAGCAMRADAYFAIVAPAWRALKAEHLGSADAPVHACEFDTSNQVAVEAFAQFFRAQHFSRFGVVVTHLTKLVDISVYQATALALLQRLKDVGRWWSFDQVRFILEQSERGDPLARKHLSNWRYSREIEGQKVSIPVDRHFMSKSRNEPGLQIADFLAHTLGASARSKLQGRRTPRADFKAMFMGVEQKLVSEVSVKEVELKSHAK